MPKLIRLYIVNAAIGFALSVVFVAALVGFDVGGLGRLILGSDIGGVALAMLVVFNGVVFAGVQFGFAIMRMAADSDDDRGQGPNLRLEPIPLRVPVQNPSRHPNVGRFPNAKR
ncbi:MAG: hypothetical protein K9G71_09795 [Rhodobacteraceae bacterium]|nr:hypothetical protein [Paracoccaceae bacterium]MCF8514570.1 hypothetical protein [Paracoccaceae bacterium]MCF8518889.1 hypothetical protein [Paracoccaceae bacterium]